MLIGREGGLKMKKSSILYVVIPCYNEEDVIEETTKRLKVKLNVCL